MKAEAHSATQASVFWLSGAKASIRREFAISPAMQLTTTEKPLWKEL